MRKPLPWSAAWDTPMPVPVPADSPVEPPPGLITSPDEEEF